MAKTTGREKARKLVFVDSFLSQKPKTNPQNLTTTKTETKRVPDAQLVPKQWQSWQTSLSSFTCQA